MTGSGHMQSAMNAERFRGFKVFVLPLLVLGLVSCGAEKTSSPTLKNASGQQEATSTSTMASGQGPGVSAPGPAAGNIEAEGSGSLTANSMDIKSVSIEPSSPSAGDTLRAVVVFNETAPPVTGLYYHWKINGQTVQESPSPELNLPTGKGDRVEVVVFVGGQNQESKAVRAYASIGNSPPSLRKVDERLDEKGLYVAKLESLDKDGDSVNLTLQRGPEGMTLDAAKRELHWPVPKGAKGSFPVEVLAGDASGGQVLFAYSITIRQQ